MLTTSFQRIAIRTLHLPVIALLFNACATPLATTAASTILTATASSQTVKVDVSMSNQTLEGWGTSLSWFASGVGGWTNTTNQTNLMNALFSPSSGLGLNYLRYNIPGGNDPLCGTGGLHYACITPWYHGVPGYEPSSGTYDWTQDSTQRWVALHAQSLGANLFEASSFSPPYWMTNSGTSEGGVNGADNLASGYYGSGTGTFADYLTTVAQHFSSSFGITFHHLEALNEPGQTWWTAGSTKQEGCGFTSLTNQETMIQGLQTSLASKGLVTQVAAMDEFQEGVLNSSSGTAAYEFYNYDPTSAGDISQINSHGYSTTTGSVALATSALHYGKRLTMSEWGPFSGDTTGKDLSNQILADMYMTRPSAWVIWQPDWPGLLNIDYTNQAYTLNEDYYVFEQYTKFIRPGFQFIAIADSQSLAAFNQQTQTLVIVTQNWSNTNRSVTYQLTNFTNVGPRAAVYRTSATENFASKGNISISNSSFTYTANRNSVTTFVIQNTSYTPSATTVNDNTTGTGQNQFNYVGGWGYYNAQTGAYQNDNHWSSTANDYYSFQFSGQQARVYASMSGNGGIAGFSIDGGPETYFDTYAATRADNVFLFATPTLASGTHTLKVRVTGLKNAASSGYNVPADRIDVVSSVGQVGQGIYRIVNAYTGLDLEVNGASLADGGTVDQWTDVSGANNEHWNLMAVGDGSYRIVNVNSGLDLEDNGWGTANGSVADQWQDNGAGSTNEFWRLTQNADGSYKIVNAYSGLLLEDYGFQTGNGAKVDQWADNGGANQHWTLIPAQ
jgi:O-glycosyl hydrolase